MGLFDGDEVFTADATAAKLFEEEADPIKKSTITAILAGHDIHKYHMIAYYNSYVIWADRYLRYGISDYELGLPTGKVYATVLDPALVEGPIEAEIGEQITVQQSYFTQLKIDIYIYDFLQNAYGWNSSTNRVSINGKSLLYVGYETNAADAQPGIPAVPASIITLQFKEDLLPEIYPQNINYPEAGVWAHAIYTLVGDSVKRYWVYDPRTGVYPPIDDAINNTTPYGDQFYPIVPIREDGKMLNETQHPTLYPSAKRILKKLQLDIGDLQDALSGEGLEEEDKPNLEDLDDAWFLFGVDIYTQVEQSIEYLYNFLEGLAATTPSTKAAYEASLADVYLEGTEPITSAYHVEEGQFNMFLEYNYIDITLGVVGDIGAKYVNDVEFDIGTEIHIHTEFDGDGNPYPDRPIYIQHSYVSLKKDNGNGTYDELILHGPVHASRVSALDHMKTVLKYIDKTFIDSPSNAGKSGFYLPVSHVTLNEVFDRVDQEIVLYDAMILAVYAGHIEELDWWQSGPFRILVKVIVLVISVLLLTFGPAGVSLSVAIMQAMIGMIIAMMVSVAVTLLIEELGGIFGTVLALALVVISLYYAPGNALEFSMNTAQEFVNAVPVFIQALDKVSGVYFQSEMAGLQEEQESFMKDYAEQQQELDDAWDLLGPVGSPYDPLYVTQNTHMMNPNETVTQFFDRTAHTGNPGVLTLDQIENYVSNLLKLPEPDNSDYVVVH